VEIVFVHPVAALTALAGLVPLAAWWRLDRRGRRVRTSLGLPPPSRRSRALLVAAVATLALLVGVASAQPVLLRAEPLRVRADAEAYFVIDITRSMLASAGPDEPTRLERARRAAARLRRAAPDVPVGIASFTNRIVPHIFPTANAAVFDSGLVRSVEIDRPPPDTQPGALLTALDALAPLQTHNFFSPDAKRRVAVVFTDGESQPVSPATIRALTARPRLDLLLVRFWSARERIHRPRLAIDRDYRPEPASTALLEGFARDTGARLYGEDDLDAAADELRRRLGRGEAVPAGEEVSARSLTAWTLALAVVPLGILLWRRNLA
jgi:hypothetical protein